MEYVEYCYVYGSRTGPPDRGKRTRRVFCLYLGQKRPDRLEIQIRACGESKSERPADPTPGLSKSHPPGEMSADTCWAGYAL